MHGEVDLGRLRDIGLGIELNNVNEDISGED